MERAHEGSPWLETLVGRRVVVTGAHGFIGRRMVRWLDARGVEVIAWGRRAEDGARAVDLRDPVAVVEGVIADRPELVVHLAAKGVAHVDTNASWIVGANVAMVANLIDALDVHAKGARLVSAGTMAEYGEKPDGDLREDDPTIPATAYGISKLASGLYLRQYAPKRGIASVHARLFGVCGPGEEEPRIFPTLLRRLREGVATPLTDGRQVRDFVQVDDACEALARIAATEALSDGMPINVGTGRGIAIREVFERLADELDVSRDLLELGRRAPGPMDRARLVADVTRLRDAIGWVPPPLYGDGVSVVERLETGSNARDQA